MHNIKRTVIFTNGVLPDLNAARALIDPGDWIIAADGGLQHVRDMGLLPAVVIGDMDSLTETEIQALSRSMHRKNDTTGICIVRYPPDKDKTDLELALAYAHDKGCKSILVLAAFGGRLDQTLANLALLTHPAWRAADIRLDDGVEEAFFVAEKAKIHGRPGDLVSLQPWGKPVVGVTTEGLKWALDNESLYPHQTRGISNEMLSQVAAVSIASGKLLVIHRRTGSFSR